MNTILKAIAVCMVFVISACGSGGYNSTSRGDITINGSSPMALGGSQYITIAYGNGPSLENPIKLTITSSDSSVVKVIENNCNNGLTDKEYMCSIFVLGNNLGNATLSVSASGYSTVTESITVARQWGPFAGVVPNLSHVDHMSVSGDNVFITSSTQVFKSSNGYSWQEVGGGPAYEESGQYHENSIASEGNSVCLALNKSHQDVVVCSVNGAPWQRLPKFIGYDLPSSISIYKGVVYVFIVQSQTPDYVALACPLANCSSWQQQGQTFFGSFTHYTSFPGGFYKGTAFTGGKDGIYYQDVYGNWKIYGKQRFSFFAGIISINEMGIFTIPLDIKQFPFQQNIYYNSPNNLGGEFAAIGGGIIVYEPNGNFGGVVLAHNTLFTQAGNNIIYSSSKIGDNWTSWTPFSNSNEKFTGVYTNGSKLYTIEANTGQAYVYTLE